MLKRMTLICTLAYYVTPVFAQTENFNHQIQNIYQKHFQEFKDLEYFSGSALSIGIPNQPIKNYYLGKVSHAADSADISANTLFQIGSITKSFTAVVMLQLEKENKLKLNDRLDKWLPKYPKWGDLTLQSLLNMSSGLPNYSDAPLMNSAALNLSTQWSNEQLIDYVYPKTFNPPLKSGYFYTNTGYVLADIIIEKITQHSFQEELTKRTIAKANLKNTYYPLPTIPSEIPTRLASGYNYNQYDNPAMVGKEISKLSLTWAAAAGALISNSEDIIKWVRALFIDNSILTSAQKKLLTQRISLATGKPIDQVSEKDPFAFGLGVAEGYEKQIGHFWFYEGQTLGYRAFYIYVPCNKIIISTIFNSATNVENDHGKLLLLEIYKTILNQHPALNCQKNSQLTA